MATTPGAYDPSTTSTAHDLMVDRLRELRIVMQGSTALRNSAEEYLPKFERESSGDYDARLKNTRLRRNMFRQAVERITGRIFEIPVKLQDASEMGEQIAGNADLKRNNLDRLARNMFKGALQLGMAHILVEFPINEAKNLKEERDAGLRPYLLHLQPEQILACYEDTLTGAVTYLKWLESETKWNEIKGEEETVEIIQERFPGRWVKWVKQDAETTGQSPVVNPQRETVGWIKEKEGLTTQADIMFHTLYADREAHMVARSPLQEVSDLTIDHWQVGSDYKNCLQHVLFPMLYATGVDQKDINGGEVVLGPKTILGSEKADARFGYIEHTGKAIEAGYKDLEGLEQRAEAYAGRLTKATGDVKATTEALNTAEVSSFAKDLALSLQDILQTAMNDAAKWLKADTVGTVVVSTEFAVDLADDDMTQLGGMRSRGDLPRRAYWKEAMRRNVLSRDFDMDEAEGDLEDEEEAAFKREEAAMKAAAEISAAREPKDDE